MIPRIDLRGAEPGRLRRAALAGVLPRAAPDPRAGGIPSTKGVLS